MQKLTKFKVIFDLFTVCVYFTQQQNCKLYYIYLMIISEIQSEIGHCSCDGENFKAPADFSHHAILLYDIVLKTPSSASLRISCLIKCRRIVSKSFDELSPKNVWPLATFRYISVCSATKFLCSNYK